MLKETMRALIAGGGIGGLAAAVALRRAGIEVLVLERAPRIEEVGAGLSLWANAMLALRCLGVEERVAEAGSILSRAITITSQGKPIHNVDLGAINQIAGADSVCAHRADLQRALAEALPDAAIRTGTAYTRFTEESDGISVLLEHGGKERGDLLIGADGIRSVIRRQLLGDAPPRYAGYVALRGIANTSGWLPPGEQLFVQGLGVQVGVLPCGRDRTYWFATRNAKARTRWTKQQMLDLFRGWPEVVKAVVAGTGESAIVQSDVIDRPPSPRWGQGRVTLLGDAIHPTTPNLGQGACQALEDAVALGGCLGKHSSIEESLRAYESRRKGRTAMVTERSWRLGRMLQWENPAAAWVRDALARTAVGRRAGTRMFQELLMHQEADCAKAAIRN
jgi:2-polyprenyl-6-methoxyphenol hydroxylase-like FAD-dependent oxidoreductase